MSSTDGVSQVSKPSIGSAGAAAGAVVDTAGAVVDTAGTDSSVVRFVSSLAGGRLATAASSPLGPSASDPPAGAGPMSEAALAISFASDDGDARPTSQPHRLIRAQPCW